MAGRREFEGRRRLGIALGATGLVLLFAPALLFRFVSPGAWPALTSAMVLGIVVLLAGFLKTPRRTRPKP